MTVLIVNYLGISRIVCLNCPNTAYGVAVMKSNSRAKITVLAVTILVASVLILSGCRGSNLASSGHDLAGTSKLAKETKTDLGKESTTETAGQDADGVDTTGSVVDTDLASDQKQVPPVGGSLEETETLESTATPQRTLFVGSRGDDVKWLQERLTAMGYSPGEVSGKFDSHTRHAVVAFQKVNGLARDGAVGPKTLEALQNPKTVSAKYNGDHIEVNKDLQILMVIKGDKIEKIISTSTGSGGRTPSVESPVYRKEGYRYVSRKYGGVMYWSSFFYKGVAVHGFSSVPPYPASHGCVRIPIADSKYVYDNMPVDSMVYVY